MQVLDLAQDLRMKKRAADMIDLLVFEPISPFAVSPASRFLRALTNSLDEL